jgi:hypothetical protein
MLRTNRERKCDRRLDCGEVGRREETVGMWEYGNVGIWEYENMGIWEGEESILKQWDADERGPSSVGKLNGFAMINSPYTFS